MFFTLLGGFGFEGLPQFKGYVTVAHNSIELTALEG